MGSTPIQMACMRTKIGELSPNVVQKYTNYTLIWRFSHSTAFAVEVEDDTDATRRMAVDAANFRFGG
jgi:hypothetical protein